MKSWRIGTSNSNIPALCTKVTEIYESPIDASHTRQSFQNVCKCINFVMKAMYREILGIKAVLSCTNTSRKCYISQDLFQASAVLSSRVLKKSKLLLKVGLVLLQTTQKLLCSLFSPITLRNSLHGLRSYLHFGCSST